MLESVLIRQSRCGRTMLVPTDRLPARLEPTCHLERRGRTRLRVRPRSRRPAFSLPPA